MEISCEYEDDRIKFRKDKLHGKAGNDMIRGSGNDQLFRSNSKDVLTGGPGNDQFNCCAGIQDLARATQYTRCVVNLLNEQVDIDPDVYNHYLVVLLELIPVVVMLVNIVLVSKIYSVYNKYQIQTSYIL
jgi:hypothetical protein